ncbi:major facilitator superfamily domain-containing protein [Lipomyces starkeyi]
MKSTVENELVVKTTCHDQANEKIGDADAETYTTVSPKSGGPSLITDWDQGLIGWDFSNKFMTMVLVLVSAFMIPAASTLFAPGESIMAKEFGLTSVLHISTLTSSVVKQLTVSVYILGFGWAPLSEMYGRKHVIIISNFLFTCHNMGCSEARSVAMFLIFRALYGVLGCAGLVVGAGIISDMYLPQETGGFTSEYAGWRWTFRMIECVGGTNPVILLRRLVFFALSIYMLIVFSYFYVFFTTITTVLTTKYGWSVELAGLSFIGIGCGTFFSVLAVGYTNDRLVMYLTKRNCGIREPEMRLLPTIVGSIMVAASMFWYGWGVQFPLVMSFFSIGAGMIASLIPIQAYIIDATTALNILRFSAAALIPMCPPTLIAKLDYGWGYSVLGFLAAGLCTTMSLLFVKFGKPFCNYPSRI